MNLTLLFLICFVILVSGDVELKLGRTDRRLARTERKLDLILGHLGLKEFSDAELADVDALLSEGKRVQAIKRYREVTGADLKEAKEAVDLRAAEAGGAEA